ncbi:MAG: winged helix-turn-helix transcriptional regulator [Nanoarchaeota archaeon]|nr:winged helix-turn-helix transcriptional regulator [Nanoarchaeota archaeon]
MEKEGYEKFGEKFGENELKVIALLRYNSKITVVELAEKVKISTRGIEKILQRLKKKNIIKRIGSAKGGHWEVKE